MDKDINIKLMDIYNKMLEFAGPKHWWPADTGFEVIVGAILTQFVSWKNVVTAIDNLKKANILSIDRICDTDHEKLSELIKSTRFYTQKAKKLKDFCFHIKDNYNGDLSKFFQKDIPTLRKELLSMYGIGEETADCIMLYAGEKPIFVVDAYTRRIFSRLGFFEENVTYSKMQEFFMDNLEKDVCLFNDYHAQIDGIGGSFCNSKKPKCDKCQLNGMCIKVARMPQV